MPQLTFDLDALGLTTRFQPVLKPTTWGEYAAVRKSMIDTHGRPLVVDWCDRCGHEHFTVEPHTDEVPCPTCGSTRTRCLRPSGHEAAAWHRERVDALDALSAERQAAGQAVVAPWPVPSPAPPLFEL